MPHEPSKTSLQADRKPLATETGSLQEARLFHTTLQDWCEEPQVILYGAIIICRKGRARLLINFKEWKMYKDAVITIFPNDVVLLERDEEFEVEMLQYNDLLLREASLQLEQTVYSSLREDRCRQDTPIVTGIIDNMFGLLKIYFD